MQSREDHRHTPPKYMQCQRDTLIGSLRDLVELLAGVDIDEYTARDAGWALEAVLAKHRY